MMPSRLMAWPMALVLESSWVVTTWRTKKGPFNLPLPLVSKVCAAAGRTNAAQQALMSVRIRMNLLDCHEVVALMIHRGGPVPVVVTVGRV